MPSPFVIKLPLAGALVITMLFRSMALSKSKSFAARSNIAVPPSSTAAGTSLTAPGASLIPPIVITISCDVPSNEVIVTVSVSDAPAAKF